MSSLSTYIYLKLSTFLVVQWLRLHAPCAGGPGLVPDQGTSIPHAATKRSIMPQLA